VFSFNPKQHVPEKQKNRLLEIMGQIRKFWVLDSGCFLSLSEVFTDWDESSCCFIQ